MTTTFPALMSLLTSAGAVALAVRGAMRWRNRQRTPRAPRVPPPTPREIAPPPPQRRPRARAADLPDTDCAQCGTRIPGIDRLCAVCARREAAAAGSARTTLLHWLVTLVGLTLLYGGAYLLAP